MTSGHKKVDQVQESQNQETNETREYSVKDLPHFVDWHCLFPEEKPLLKYCDSDWRQYHWFWVLQN